MGNFDKKCTVTKIDIITTIIIQRNRLIMIDFENLR